MPNFSQPKENLLRLKLKEGMKVADLGAGAGHYAHAAAAIVGREGKVYAVEVRKDMLQHIEESTRQHHRGIIEPIWGDIEKLGGTGLRDHSMDTVILANTLFQIEDKEGLVAEIKRIIKPGGKILIVDWSGSFGGLGPAPDAVVSERDAEKLFTDASFHKLETFRGGPHHYALLYNASAP